MEVLNDEYLRHVLPTSITFIKYNDGMRCGAVKHQDVYSTFATAVSFLQDTATGRLYIENTDLLETLQSGDVVLMYPCQVHEVISQKEIQIGSLLYSLCKLGT